jgi:hypothetical protein
LGGGRKIGSFEPAWAAYIFETLSQITKQNKTNVQIEKKNLKKSNCFVFI